MRLIPIITFILHVVIARGQLATTADARADLLRSCYNKYYNGTPSVFEDFLRGFNTSLYLHDVLVSKKPSDLPLSIFVGATLERLSALEAQCRSFPGPLAAAIYIPLLQNTTGPQLTPQTTEALQQATSLVKGVFDRLESAAPGAASPPPTCSLTVLLLYEVVSDPALVGLVPINSLRDAALLATLSPLVAMVDVDLAPSASLVERVLRPGHSSVSELLRSCSQRSVWVLPAWETAKQLSMDEGTRVAERALRGDKADLQRLDQEARLHYFAKLAYPRGHAATNFSHWLATDVPYVVPYEINYEPWFIMSRELVLPYDVRFRGYGWNKVQQVAYVALRNFTFWVQPHAWLVHRPHDKSRGQMLYGEQHQQQDGRRRRARDELRTWKGATAPLGRLFHRRVSALRHVAIRDMRRGTYVAAVDPQVRHCMEVLPWWAAVRDEAWGRRGGNPGRKG